MDPTRFDAFARRLAGTLPRRAALGGLAALLVPAFRPAAIQAVACAPTENLCTWTAHGKHHAACVPSGQCCPDMKPCEASCISKLLCCTGERSCTTKVHGRWQSSCVPESQCCPGDRSCGNGTCVPKDGCCPRSERACQRRGKTVCVPLAQCCDGEKLCNGSCIDAATCCPGVERPCQNHGKTVCVPLAQCCDGYAACPVDPDGCCHTLAGEECAAFDGCCDTIVGQTVCDGNWCCDEGEDCVPGVGCRPHSTCGTDAQPCIGLDGKVGACCNPGELCCNGTCCAAGSNSKCCPGHTGCFFPSVDCSRIT